MTQALEAFKKNLDSAQVEFQKQELNASLYNEEVQRIIDEKRREAEHYSQNFRSQCAPQMSEDVRHIVNTLNAQPFMVEPVKKLLTKLAAELNAAIQNTLAKYE